MIILMLLSQYYYHNNFEKESFNLWRLLMIITLYHQTKTQIGFWCRQELNPRSSIQPSETLLIELTGIHFYNKG